MPTPLRLIVPALIAVVVAAGTGSHALRAQDQDAAQSPPDGQEGFEFHTGVEMINVTATVTDRNGRFVQGLSKDDFIVYDDDVRQEIAHFSSDPVPVSLGILFDTSGSMTVGRMASARAAIDRFVFELLGEDDELFFMTFGSRVELVEGWTTDRRAISQAARSTERGGSTAMYDAVAEALPLAEAGRHRKKALLVITDGHDTSSRTPLPELAQLIRETEVMIYALGVEETTTRPNGPTIWKPLPQIQFPVPGGRGRRRPGGIPVPGPGPIPIPGPVPTPSPLPPATAGWPIGTEDRVNGDALKELTDDSGGRTEIVNGFENLDAATARLADELSKQYSLGYMRSGERDGKWHTIRVEIRDRRLNVRARQGYFAS